MTARTPNQTITDLSSHDEDVNDEGGKDGYPSDLQTTPKKYFVSALGTRDQAAELFDSETMDDCIVRKRAGVRQKGFSRERNDQSDQSADDNTTSGV